MRTEIHTQRLRTLSEKLRTVKPEAFSIYGVVRGRPETIGCGSTACAIGHCPILFPEEWQFCTDEEADEGFWFTAELKNGSRGYWLLDAAKFFGLNSRDSGDLFMPSEFSDEPGATASDVADAIDKLLAESAGAK